MVDGDGRPLPISAEELAAALRRTPKGKAPGATGITADVMSLMPKAWVELAARLATVVARSRVSPAQWRVDLTSYVHKGGSDRTLGNWRPIMLLDVLSKVIMRVLNDRMQAAWRRT